MNNSIKKFFCSLSLVLLSPLPGVAKIATESPFSKFNHGLYETAINMGFDDEDSVFFYVVSRDLRNKLKQLNKESRGRFRYDLVEGKGKRLQIVTNVKQENGRRFIITITPEGFYCEVWNGHEQPPKILTELSEIQDTLTKLLIDKNWISSSCVETLEEGTEKGTENGREKKEEKKENNKEAPTEDGTGISRVITKGRVVASSGHRLHPKL